MTEQAFIWTETGSTFALDATTTENHARTSQTTSNPVESGAVISDHTIIAPATLTLTGVMVDVNSAKPPLEKLTGVLQAFIDNPNFIDDISIPGTLKNITDQTVEFVDRSIDLIATTISSLVDGVSSEQRALAPWIPTLFPSDAVDFSDGKLRIAQAYDQLFAIQKSGLPVSVVTSTALYSNMIITSVKVDIDASKGNFAVFTLAFQEVLIVDTQNTSMTNTQHSQLIGTCSGRTAAQTAAPRNAGEVTPTTVSESDAAKWGEVL
jgi:hypothetical protein